MKKTLIYIFVLAIIAVITGYFLFGSGYDFNKHKLEGERKLEKKESTFNDMQFVYPVKINTKVKDGFFRCEFNVALSSESGMKEFERKYERINYGIRIVLKQYYKRQIKRRKLERSTLRKIIQSQIKDKVIKVEVVSFEKI